MISITRIVFTKEERLIKLIKPQISHLQRKSIAMKIKKRRRRKTQSMKLMLGYKANISTRTRRKRVVQNYGRIIYNIDWRNLSILNLTREELRIPGTKSIMSRLLIKEPQILQWTVLLLNIANLQTPSRAQTSICTTPSRT